MANVKKMAIQNGTSCRGGTVRISSRRDRLCSSGLSTSSTIRTPSRHRSHDADEESQGDTRAGLRGSSNAKRIPARSANLVFGIAEVSSYTATQELEFLVQQRNSLRRRDGNQVRSEERRVGKEWRSWWSR